MGLESDVGGVKEFRIQDDVKSRSNNLAVLAR